MQEDYPCSHQTELKIFSQKNVSVLQNKYNTYTYRRPIFLYISRYKTEII